MKRLGTMWVVFVLLLMLVVFVLSLTSSGRMYETPTYSGLLKSVHNPSSGIEKVIMTNESPVVRVKYEQNAKEQSVIVPMEAKESLIKELNDANIPILVNPSDKSSVWIGMLSSFFLPVLVIVGLLFVFRSAQASQVKQAGSMTLVETDRIEGLEVSVRWLV